MNTQVETLENGEVKLTVTVEAAEINNRIKKTYKDFSHKYKFPGFRAGHAPRPVIDNMLGKDAVVTTVTDDVLNQTFPLAVDENDLSLISAPKFGDVDSFVVEGEDFVYSVTFAVKPELELSEYGPAHIQVPVKEATDADVDAQIENITNYYYDFKNSPANTKLKEDGFCDITIKATDDNGEELPAFTAEERLYEMGKGLFPAAFDAEILGMKKGENKSFSLNVEENPCMLFASLKDSDTKNVNFDVTIAVIKKKVTPEVTDEWVKENLGVDTVEELRSQIAVEVAAEKSRIIPRILEDKALMELQKRLSGEAPESMVEDAERDLLQTFFTQLQQQGMTLDAFLAAQGITADQFKDDVKHQASDSVLQNLALDAYARHEGIAVTEEELMDEFVNSGAEDPKQLFEEWKNEGRLHMVREGIMRGKALEAFLKVAEVEETDDPTADDKDAE